MRLALLHDPSWAKTSLGTPLEMIQWQAGNTTQAPDVLLLGGVHGDEPEGVHLAQHLLQWLGTTDVNLKLSGALIPCLNPDGYQKNQRTNANGVDLNRNFPSHDWSPLVQKPRYHPGVSAGSELEVQAVVKWLENKRPRLIVHFHSWEPCVVYTGVPAKAAAVALAGSTGFPTREDIGYPTPGSLGQYGWQNLHIPVICIESPEGISPREIWSLFGPGLQRLLQSPELLPPLAGGKA